MTIWALWSASACVFWPSGYVPWILAAVLSSDWWNICYHSIGWIGSTFCLRQQKTYLNLPRTSFEHLRIGTQFWHDLIQFVASLGPRLPKIWKRLRNLGAQYLLRSIVQRTSFWKLCRAYCLWCKMQLTFWEIAFIHFFTFVF